MQKDITLLRNLWARANKYQRLLERGTARVEKFGVYRYIFFRRFAPIKLTLQRYRNTIDMYSSLAISVSRRIKLTPTVGGKFDH